jgi:hypothetical protein
MAMAASCFSGEIANNATADVTVDEYHRYKVTNCRVLVILFRCIPCLQAVASINC